MTDKPKLPSIKDLLEGGPGLIDFTRPPLIRQKVGPTINNTHILARHGHRRYASEQTLHNNNRLLPPPPSPSLHKPPSTSKSTTMSLPMDMQLLSLDKNKLPVPSRGRTHSRSYSDLTYPTNTHHQIYHVQKPDQEASPTEEQDEREEEDIDLTIDIGINIIRSSSSGKYMCPYCSKGFPRPSSLRTHTFSHTGEKPFLCPEPSCGKKFSVQSNLRRHSKTHRPNKPTTFFLAKNIN